jgi:hypothetical protein
MNNIRTNIKLERSREITKQTLDRSRNRVGARLLLVLILYSYALNYGALIEMVALWLDQLASLLDE